jgi:manganese transport protein
VKKVLQIALGIIAAIGGFVDSKANFDLVRDGYGRRLGICTLVASVGLSFLTLAAELGGVGLVLNLFFDVSDRAFMLIGTIGVLAAAWLLRFGAIERIFGYGGLCLLVYLVGAVNQRPDWSAFGSGFVPHAPSSAVYAYFLVGLIAAALMPYEIYFYSSGGIEEAGRNATSGSTAPTRSSATASADSLPPR